MYIYIYTHTHTHSITNCSGYLPQYPRPQGPLPQVGLAAELGQTSKSSCPTLEFVKCIVSKRGSKGVADVFALHGCNCYAHDAVLCSTRILRRNALQPKHHVPKDRTLQHGSMKQAASFMAIPSCMQPCFFATCSSLFQLHAAGTSLSAHLTYIGT